MKNNLMCHSVGFIEMSFVFCRQTNLHDFREPRRQQEAAAAELGDGEAAAVPRAVGLAEGEQLEEGAHHVVGQLLGQAVGDAAHALGG